MQRRPYKLDGIFPSGAIYDLTQLPAMDANAVACEMTGDPAKRCLAAFERHGYPGLPDPENNPLAPESVLGRYLFGWEDKVPPARLWITPAGKGGQDGALAVAAEGTFSVLLTTKALRASLHDGTLVGNGRAKAWKRVYSFVIPLAEIDYLAGSKTIATIGCHKPETRFESIAVFPASDSWSAKLGWKLHHRTPMFNAAVADAVARVLATSDDQNCAERARQVLEGKLGTYGTRQGGVLEFR